MNIALPCLILKAFSNIDLAAIFDARVYLSYYPVAFLVFAIGWLVAKYGLKKGPTNVGLLAMGSCFANLGLVGLPIIEATWGEKGVALLAIVLSIHPAVMFTLSIGVIESTASNRKEMGRPWYYPLLGLFKNTIILSVLIGGALSLLKVEMPVPILSFLNVMSGAAGPCALFCVGAFLAQARFQTSFSSLYASVFKVMLMPVLIYCVGRFVFALEVETLLILTFIGGLPTGANVSVLSQYYRTAEADMSSVISAATLLSFVTLPAIIWLLS